MNVWRKFGRTFAMWLRERNYHGAGFAQAQRLRDDAQAGIVERHWVLEVSADGAVKGWHGVL